MKSTIIPENITVVIPLFNKEETIRRALLSIIKQDSEPFEILVIDDGSTDQGANIIHEITKEYPFVRLIAQENRGVSAARNLGVKNAETEYVCFLDADDEWEPNYLVELIHLINNNPEADFYGLRYRIYRNENYEYPSVSCEEGFSGLVPEFISTYRNGYGLIHSSSVCFRKDFFEELGGFPEGKHNGEDIYLWLLAGIKGTYAFSYQIGSTVNKEDLSSEVRRKTNVPYHLTYFTENLNNFPVSIQNQLHTFLIKNLTLHWAAAKREKNKWLSDILLDYAKKLNRVFYLSLRTANIFPPVFFHYLAKRRSSSRQK